MAEKNIVLLKMLHSCSDLYKYMGMTMLSVTELYSLVILPNFHHLPGSSKPIHMNFIRNDLLKKAEKFTQQQEELLEQLRGLAFIEVADGSLHRADEFYSSRNSVFKEMIDPCLFPPFPYDDPEWDKFLEYAGLITTVTVEMFESFARKVEHMGKRGIDENVRRKSEIKHLKLFHNKFVKHGDLKGIGCIKFLLPYVVCDKLSAIFSQFQDGQHLVSYSESLSPHCKYFVWTSCPMFAYDADPSYWSYVGNSNQLISSLGIKKRPSEEKLTEHLQNICSSLVKKQKESHIKRLSDISGIVQRIMSSIYNYLKEIRDFPSLSFNAKSLCMIYVPSEKSMIFPEEVVLNISDHEIITGYVYQVPQEFLEFVPVFLKLGAQKDVNANVYANALQKLYSQTKGHRLHENELQVVQTSLKLMFDFISRENERKSNTLVVSHIYLPNMDFILKDSKTLVLVDNEPLFRRVKYLDLEYFLGFRKLKLDRLDVNPTRTMSMLPKRYSLQTLSSLVKEQVAYECKENACPITTKANDTSFVNAIIRLVNHEKWGGNEKYIETSETKLIEERLSHFQVFEVETLYTVLQYEGQIVAQSDFKKKSFLEKEKIGNVIKVQLYLDSTTGKTRNKALTTAIRSLTGGLLGDQIIHIGDLLDLTPSERETYLDELQIKEYNHILTTKDESAFSPPGSLIPPDMHWLLDDDFHFFVEGEYVGLEIFDPDIDTDIKPPDSSGGGPVYIYAIVKKVLIRETSWIRGRYLIDVGNGRQEEICATKLYKFWREKSFPSKGNVDMPVNVQHEANTKSMNVHQGPSIKDTNVQPKDLHTVLKEIREILKDAWANCDVRDRDRVKKRLYLKWHPDKNPGREEFCTEVCKYIQQYIQKLEMGLDLDEEATDMRRGGASNRYEHTHSTFFDHMDRRTSYQREQFKRYEEKHRQQNSGRFPSGFHGSTSYNCHWSARNDAHPQPQEARRWFRQAKLDMESAKDTLGLHRGFNWICFKSQQAAEKAIKAIWFIRNANVADSLRSHDITMTSAGLNNPRLSELATQLQAVVGNYNRMRYPDRLSFPFVPGDVYTEQHASQACQLAADILSLAEEILQL